MNWMLQMNWLRKLISSDAVRNGKARLSHTQTKVLDFHPHEFSCFNFLIAGCLHEIKWLWLCHFCWSLFVGGSCITISFMSLLIHLFIYRFEKGIRNHCSFIKWSSVFLSTLSLYSFTFCLIKILPFPCKFFFHIHVSLNAFLMWNFYFVLSITGFVFSFLLDCKYSDLEMHFFFSNMWFVDFALSIFFRFKVLPFICSSLFGYSQSNLELDCGYLIQKLWEQVFRGLTRT